jgi:hypothetical protein
MYQRKRKLLEIFSEFSSLSPRKTIRQGIKNAWNRGLVHSQLYEINRMKNSRFIYKLLEELKILELKHLSSTVPKNLYHVCWAKNYNGQCQWIKSSSFLTHMILLPSRFAIPSITTHLINTSVSVVMRHLVGDIWRLTQMTVSHCYNLGDYHQLPQIIF